MGFHKNIKRQLIKIQREIDKEIEGFYQRLEEIEKKIEEKYFREENENEGY